MTYEEKINRIKEIIKQLQDAEQNISLDNAVKLYEEGINLIKECEDYIKQVEGKIKEVTKTQQATENTPQKIEEDLDLPF